LGCTLPESKQESWPSVDAVGPKEHPDEENIRTRADTRASLRLDWRPFRDCAGPVELLAARLILEEASEGEVRDEIGRERYERADGEARGYRNGYRPGQMKTAEGMVEFSAPQVRDTPEPFVSAIRENLAGRTQALELSHLAGSE
jgi:Transposase, Mutator family